MFVELMALATLALFQDSPPPECRRDARGAVDYQACFDATAPGSPLHNLAIINLASIATLENDYVRAVALYDSIDAGPGQTLRSDSMFHALRAHAFDRVGRHEDAIADARLAAQFLAGNVPAEMSYTQANPIPDGAYAYILPILWRNNDPGLDAAVEAYLRLPTDDLVAISNQAVVLLEIGRLDAALAANSRAMAIEPNHPAIQNSQCYILTLMGRAAEGLPHCERAIELAPDVAPVRHSYASALAAIGLCAQAERQMGEARRLEPTTLLYQETLACVPT